MRKEHQEGGVLTPERRNQLQAKRGRRKKDCSLQIETMANGPAPLRKMDYEYHQAQAQVSYRTLRRRMNERKPRIILSNCRKTSKISDTNKALRKEYGARHRHETIDSFWQWIHWTDEAHIDQGMAIRQTIFREQGNETGLLVEEGSSGDIILHIAASVSWHHKSNLIFYNDGRWTHQHIYELWKQAKPRRNKRKWTEEEFQAQLKEWENTQPPETVKTGNSMTQAYYAEMILPQHVFHIHEQKNAGNPAILMEDGDPSHGHYSEHNLPADIRFKFKIQLHNHPAQSPDLNPIEGIWLLLEERLKQREGFDIHSMTYWELKKAVESAWESISIEEIRDRIKEMPWRCAHMAKTNGNRVRGRKW
jgi:hypothetical protein